MTDWDAIRKEYEDGTMSLRSLATQYDVALTTLYRHSRKWQAPNAERNAEQQKKRNAEHVQVQLMKIELPSPANAVEGANIGIDSLVTYLKKYREGMDLSDHVKAANALSQYNKILINAVPDDEETDVEQEDFSSFTDDELLQYAEFQERAKKTRSA